jgi:hypothetical protein
MRFTACKIADCLHVNVAAGLPSYLSRLTTMKALSLSTLAGLFSLLLVFATPVTAADVGVRIRFGLTDDEPTKWDGTVSVKPGKVATISGWRWAQDDHANGTEGWAASTRTPVVAGRNNAQKGKAKAADGAPAKAKKAGQAAKAKNKAKAAALGAMADNGVLLMLTDVNESSVVTVKTEHGEFNVALSQIPYGKFVRELNGAVEIDRTSATRQATADPKTDDDYPSAAVAKDGTVYVTYESFTPGIDRNERAKGFNNTEPSDFTFLTKAPGGDQLFVRTLKGQTIGEALAVTEPGADIYKSTVAVAGDGTVWIFWSQNKSYKPFPNNPAANFDIWARSLKDGKLGEAMKISNSEESDVWPVATTDSNGKVWVAWQGARKSAFKILERHQSDNGWSAEATVSSQSRNCWAPAIAAAPTGGKVSIAWDTYEKGDYDVYVRDMSASGPAGDARPVANSNDYEARPAMTYDKQGALWIAYELSGPSWGKDFSSSAPYEQRDGIGLYRDRQVGVSIWKDGKWMEPQQLVALGLPGSDPRVRIQRNPEPGEVQTPATEEQIGQNSVHNNLARIACDASGRVWILARVRHTDFRAPIGTVWMTHAAYYEGNQWVGPVLVPHSDNLLYNSPAVVPVPNGGVVVAHSSDHRQARRGPAQGAGAQGVIGQDPYDNDLYISHLSANGDAKPGALVASKVLPDPSGLPSQATQKERSEIERIRGYRATIGGKELRVTRGEFHRHTEISQDGQGDGPLEDMWRYAIDVAGMDWLACSDHDNGNGREYTWWLTQKTTDAFRLPGLFEPPYAYERSVRYPEGHRNVIFTRRGIRTLPRLTITDRDDVRHAPDTQMLYKYLKFYDGVCASHTSATGMGTDWRDNDPLVEPMVEIYQGCRQNYERPGAPRCPTEELSIGGWEPKGFINLALMKGYKFSFESSSDHVSTHISYSMIYAEGNSRDAMIAAMKKRHTYAATDNIIADYRCKVGDKEYMMGDAFTTAQPPTVWVKFVGSAPIAKVTLVKDDVETVLGQPNKAEIEYTWTDPKPTPGKESYYYVRGEQADGELVWASPMWITYQPK